MTTLPGSLGEEPDAATANKAYEPMKHVGRLEEKYEITSSSPLGSPPSPLPSYQPLPAVPPPLATPTFGGVGGAGEEPLYEPISGDK